MSKLSLIILFILCAIGGYAQNINVNGTITDGDKNPIKNAVVALLTPKDSILYRFTRTDIDGKFELKNIKPSAYTLMTSHRQFADFIDDITIGESQKTLGAITLLSKTEVLREIIIKTGSIKIKGDTTSYRASDFKVDANANVEELLKKLPGIQVDRNGQIKAMGETVKKVLVDGEEFFGDDPGMAVKNLRADAIKEVQVFDQKSDQATFTGIDDGSATKTINLKLKDDKKKGYFGKVDAAGGPRTSIDPRYNTNILISSFKNKRKISGFLLNGNTGQDGLDWEDSNKFGGGNDNISMEMSDDGDVNYTWSSGNSDDEPYVNTQNGFIRNTNAGLQYSNKWKDKHTLNLSPKYNSQIYTNNNIRKNSSQFGQSQLNDNTNTALNVHRQNFMMNLVYDIKIDSMNSIKFNARTRFYDTTSNQFADATTTDENAVLKNKRQIFTDTDTNKQALSASLLFKHKFKKARRTFSVNYAWNILNSSADNFLKSDNQSYVNGVLDNNIVLDQNSIGDRSTQNNNIKVAYTEPLGKKFALQFAYSVNLNTGFNNQSTFAFDTSTNSYSTLIADLSNNFKQQIVVQEPNIKINYNSKKINYGFGTGLGFTNFNLTDVTNNVNYVRNFTNIFPSANFSYKYKSNASLRFNYNGATTQPTINQLQPLRNNQDFFNQILGNPDLKQSFLNRFDISQNSYNILNDSYIYQGLNVNFVANQITSNRDIDLQNAKTTTKPINTNGNYSVSYYGGYGFKIKKIDLQINLSPNFSYNKSVISINSIESFNNNFDAAMSVGLSKTKEKKYDFSINNNFSNSSNSTSQNDDVKSFYTNNFSFDGGIYIAEKWKLSTSYNLFTRQKTEDFQDNLSNQLWNARLQRTFKNDEFTAYILIRDILNQNVSIERYNFQNTVGEETNDRLQRYAMIGITWNFKNKNNEPK